MRERMAFILGVGLALTGCASQQTANAPSQSAAKQPTYFYAYQEPGNDTAGRVKHYQHTLMLVGDEPTGAARYSARVYYKDGSSGSLASSGGGTFSVTGTSITVNAGGLKATGEIKPGQYVEFGKQRYEFFSKIAN